MTGVRGYLNTRRLYLNTAFAPFKIQALMSLFMPDNLYSPIIEKAGSKIELPAFFL